jgi:hypothetical protein
MTSRDVRGTFWLASDANVRREGTLHVEAENTPSLSVESALTPLLNLVATSDGVTAWEPASPADQRPMTIHGSSRTGQRITLLGAQSVGRRGDPVAADRQVEVLQADLVVMGAHLSGRDHCIHRYSSPATNS